MQPLTWANRQTLQSSTWQDVRRRVAPAVRVAIEKVMSSLDGGVLSRDECLTLANCVEVSRISPAPRCSASRAHSTTVGRWGGAHLAHTPARRAPDRRPRDRAAHRWRQRQPARQSCAPMALMSAGSARAAELMLTLSAPASNTCSASRAERCLRPRRRAQTARAPCAAPYRAASGGLRASP